MKYSTTSFPPEGHKIIDIDNDDAITASYENKRIRIVRWYRCITAEGEPTDLWRVDPDAGISLTMPAYYELISTVAKMSSSGDK